MGNWSEAFTYTHWRNKPKSPPVYSRDFAYSDSKPVLVAEPSMASLSIRDTSARTFAEYVHLSHFHLPTFAPELRER